MDGSSTSTLTKVVLLSHLGNVYPQVWEHLSPVSAQPPLNVCAVPGSSTKRTTASVICALMWMDYIGLDTTNIPVTQDYRLAMKHSVEKKVC